MTTADDSSMTLRAARAVYFERNGLPPDGGYSERWVKLTRNRIPLHFLNTPPRKRAVPYHDLHHILTGYDTSFTGEGEISAWELAAGTSPHWMALLLDLVGMALGLLIAPRRTLRAFVRGRRSRSLYREALSEELLSTSIGAMRTRLGIPETEHSATHIDVLWFVGFSAAGLTALSLIFAPILIPIGFLLR